MDEPTLHWRGINHLALVTTDMDATVRFYHEVLDARWWPRSAPTTSATTSSRSARQHGRLLRVPRRRPRAVGQAGRHPGPAGRSSSTTCRSTCPTRTRCWRCATASSGHGSEVTDVVDHGFIRSIYFTDPNGIALEARWWTLDATGRDADYGDDRFFADPNPVPAVVELARAGRAGLACPRPGSADAVRHCRRADERHALRRRPTPAACPARPRWPRCTAGAAAARPSTTTSCAAVAAATAAVDRPPGGGRDRRRQRRRAGPGELLHVRPAPHDRLRRQPAAGS